MWHELALVAWPREYLEGPLTLNVRIVDEDGVFNKDDVIAESTIAIDSSNEDWKDCTVSSSGMTMNFD